MALTNYIKNKPYLLHTFTGKYDRWGFRSFLLQFVNGNKLVDSIQVISGSSSAQKRPLLKPQNDRSGSGNPIPEGIYRIGNIIRMDVIEKGVGYTKIPIDVLPDFKVNNRGEFLFHSDENKNYARGSLGCIVTYNEKDMNRIIGWCSQKARPEVLVVDYKLGLLASSGIQIELA